MAQVLAAKKGAGFLGRNWKNILVLGVVLFVGYKVTQGIGAITKPFKDFKFPEIMLPNITLPNITLPNITLPNFMQMTPMQPSVPMMSNMMNNQTPNMGTGLVQIPENSQNFIDMLTREAANMMRQGQSFRQYEQANAPIMVNPMMYAVGETNVPIPEELRAQMGLAIDMPTKRGMSPMSTLLDRVTSMKVSTARALTRGGGTLTTLAAQNPNLTASQLADLRFRLAGERPNFDFGRNTGSGRIPMFDEMNRVISTQRNPVLAAYEAYRAQYR